MSKQRFRVSLRARAFLALIILAGAVLFGRQPAGYAQGAAGWSVVSGLPVTVRLHDVFLVDETQAVAVGEDGGKGVVYQLRATNNRWEIYYAAAFPAPLYSVVATGPDRLWAVGAEGQIVELDSSGWRHHTVPVPDVVLQTIQMFGTGEEGWAGGYIPAPPHSSDYPQVALFHYKGGQWRQEPSVSGVGSIDSLHFTAGGGWAVGDDIWRHNGGGWTKEEEPLACGENFPCPHNFETVRAISANEAIAAGWRHAICTICVSRPLVMHRINGTWRIIDVPHGAVNPQAQGVYHSTTFNSAGTGLMVGWYTRGIIDPNRGHHDGTIRPMVARYQGGQWQLDQLPIDRGALQAVSMLDTGHALAVGSDGLVLAYGYGSQPNPAARVSDPRDPAVQFFPEVGHTLRGTFRGYWERNGGLPVFGYPLTEEYIELNSDTGNRHTVQYFERQRYEYHPEYRGTRYEVLLGRLGVEVLLRQGRDWTTFPKADPDAPHYFAETGHAVAPEFWDYWRTHGLDLGDQGISFRESLALFGYPISQPQMETNSSGDTVLTQWFERARFEYHPNNPEPYKVLLGRLSAELVEARGW